MEVKRNTEEEWQEYVKKLKRMFLIAVLVIFVGIVVWAITSSVLHNKKEAEVVLSLVEPELKIRFKNMQSFTHNEVEFNRSVKTNQPNKIELAKVSGTVVTHDSKKEPFTIYFWKIGDWGVTHGTFTDW